MADENPEVDAEEPTEAKEPAGGPITKVDANFDDKVEDTGDPLQGLPTSVQLLEEKTAYELDTKKTVSPRGKYIKYIGVGTVRIMGPAEWKAAHVDSDDYFEWNYLNHKEIALEAFSDAQLQYLLRVDDRFELVEHDDEKASAAS